MPTRVDGLRPKNPHGGRSLDVDERAPRRLVYNSFEPDREGLREAICALGNGLFVTRGAHPWATADAVHYPGTYLSGGYDRARSRVDGQDIENEDLVNLPNWLPVTFRVAGGPWFGLADVEISDYRQELDLERGVLTRQLVCTDRSETRWRIHETRIVHMGDPNIASQRVVVHVEDPGSGADGPRVEVRAGIDGSVDNHGVARYEDLTGRHTEVTERGGDGDKVWLRSRMLSSRVEVALGARVDVAGLAGAERHHEIEDERAFVVVEGTASQPVRIDKVVALHTDLDRPRYEPLADVHRSLDCVPGHDDLLESHTRAWAALWERTDLHLDAGDERSDMILGLHQFHMHQSYSNHVTDLDVGVPARGWHGEAYRGHIFWDEVFVLPLFDYQFPVRTRAAIRYRFRRLPEARRAATDAGHRGAMFPWQSASTGREESQQWHLNPRSGRWNPDPTHLQRHIGLAIAYNVWQHWKVTGDDEFLYDVGAELLLSIADFFASLARWDDARGRFVIENVVGPDEYHTAYPGADEPGLRNNAYTNVMTAWMLERALRVLDRLPERRCAELRGALDLDLPRIERWRAISHSLYVPAREGIIEQFEGFFELPELDWEAYRQRYGDIARLDRILEAEDDSPNNYQASKQADVVMLFYLLTAEELVETFEQLGYAFDPEDIPRNVHHYLERTSHGSTLSRVVHAWVQARSDRSASWQCYQEALESDISDIQGGTTPEGVHLGAMAGTVDLAQRGYSGLAIDDDVIRLNPRLPKEARSLSFSIRYRTHWSVAVHVENHELSVACHSQRPEPVRVAVKDVSILLHPGEQHRFDLTEVKPDDPSDPAREPDEPEGVS